METNEVNFGFFWANKETDPKLLEVLERAKYRGTRIKIYQGDKETGKLWAEEWDVMGYVGRSMGNKPIALLIPNKNSSGGAGILTHCILAIRFSNRKEGGYLYKHENFKEPVIKIDNNKVYFNGELHANCNTIRSAQRVANVLS